MKLTVYTNVHIHAITCSEFQVVTTLLQPVYSVVTRLQQPAIIPDLIICESQHFAIYDICIISEHVVKTAMWAL